MMTQLHVERCLPDGFLAAALRADARPAAAPGEHDDSAP